MERTLPHPLAIPWRTVGLAVYVGVNLGLIGYTVTRLGEGLDLDFFAALDPADPYAAGGSVWSPLMTWLLIGVSRFVGYWPLVLLHVGALALLRDRRLILLAGVSWPFWADALAGNVFGFVFVAAVLAAKGNRWGTWAYLVLCLSMPRPVQLPLLVWILWKRPEYRAGFALLTAAQAVMVIGLGFAGPWFDNLTSQTSNLNLGPGALVGYWWLVIGIPLGAWLTWTGRVGWAALAISPYILPSYWLMALVPQDRPRNVGEVAVPVDQLRVTLGSRHGRPLAVAPGAVAVARANARDRSSVSMARLAQRRREHCGVTAEPPLSRRTFPTA